METAKTEAEMEIKAVREEAARLDVGNKEADEELEKAKEKLEVTEIELSSKNCMDQKEQQLELNIQVARCEMTEYQVGPCACGSYIG